MAAAALALTLGFSAQAQVVYDPAKAAEKNPAQGAQAQAGKLGVRDQEGTVKVQDGIVRSQGSMQLLKDGKLTRVDAELKLSEGITARPNGEVVLKDGRQITLQEGQMVTLDGDVKPAPASIGSTGQGTTVTLPPRQGNLTDYGNSGITGPGAKPVGPGAKPAEKK